MELEEVLFGKARKVEVGEVREEKKGNQKTVGESRGV